jgi:hypothetical protein
MLQNQTVFAIQRISQLHTAAFINPEGPYALYGVVGPSFFMKEGT